MTVSDAINLLTLIGIGICTGILVRAVRQFKASVDRLASLLQDDIDNPGGGQPMLNSNVVPFRSPNDAA